MLFVCGVVVYVCALLLDGVCVCLMAYECGLFSGFAWRCVRCVWSDALLLGWVCLCLLMFAWFHLLVFVGFCLLQAVFRLLFVVCHCFLLVLSVVVGSCFCLLLCVYCLFKIVFVCFDVFVCC